MLSLMLAVAVAGVYSYLRLGRAEDPSFTIKVADRHGHLAGRHRARRCATRSPTAIEKKLQELPFFDKIETYTKPGFLAMKVTFKDTTPPEQVPSSSTSCARSSTTSRPSCRRACIGPQVNDEYGDVDSVLYMLTGDGAIIASSTSVVETLRQRLLRDAGRHQSQRLWRAGRAASSSSSARPSSPTSASRRRRSSNSLAQAERRQRRRRLRDAAPIACRLRVTGALERRRRPSRRRRSRPSGRVFRLGDIADVVTRGFEDPPDFLVRHKGEPAIGVGVVMAKGGNVIDARQERSTRRWPRSAPRRRSASRSTQIADQPKVVDACGRRVHALLRRGAGRSCSS